MDSDDAKASPSKSSSGGSLTNQQLATGSHGASSSNGNMKSNMKGNDDSGEQNGRKKPNTDERKSVFKVDNAPYFYVGGRNGVSLVEEPLLAKGWQRIQDPKSDRYKFRWVEIKSQINYLSFRPGEQLINRIPGSGMLATKTGLFNTLRDYERLNDRLQKGNSGKGLRILDFFPESYVLDMKADREAFFQTFKG
ncbi:putative beta-tubulin polyglutamylase [Apostichopus japonicus]|uniref:Putative beta-tubulin polyglutamylase n=1 Tax=Stichopus japonicus TaxID=307972 RepID=A0A2G8JKX2_STIJA|nr:putative beta-tubulin polyglutamylase [Apostichopus japonicus]